MDSVSVYIVSVVFVATMIRSIFGFGEALVAVPLLVLRIPLNIAAPLAVLLSITVAGFVVAQEWRKIHLSSATWLLGATLFGIPLGLLLLTSNHPRMAKMVLGLLIIGFAASSMAKLPALKTDSKAWLVGCGFFAGLLGGAYGMNGPPLAIYGSMRRWSPRHFRATLQGYFLPASTLGMIGYWWQGLWGHAVTHYYLLCLPVTLLAIWIGGRINDRIETEAFRKYVYLGVIAIGIVLLIQALTTG